ncbi:MAG TPA: ATP-binding protein [Candidatus Aquilonibacter sp.]|nr:ATP-binding protein [Candidatus Aquilonibacter sp.]
MRLPPKRQFWTTVGGVVVVLLAAAVFTLGSLTLPLHLEQGTAFVMLFSVTVFIFAALLVFGLILSRSLLRLWLERRSGQMGSRFKVKMVLGAMGVSLLPVVFLFFFSYALVNRTLNSWFPRPLETANEKSQSLLAHFGQAELGRLNKLAVLASAKGLPDEKFLEMSHAVDAMWVIDPGGAVTASQDFAAQETQPPGARPSAPTAVELVQPPKALAPQFVQTLGGGGPIWKADDQLYIAGSAPVAGGTLYVARRLPDDFLSRYGEIQSQTEMYLQQKQRYRAYKREILLGLMLMTLLLVFAATWAALFLSKQVTVPIQALAEATREISHGNFDYRIEDMRARDELGMLVRSFNRMTEQLGEGRRQINDFTQSLEQAIQERERRRQLMEAILENIPTGVVSLNATGEIARVNSAVATILGDYVRNAVTLQELLGEDAARDVLHLMRRSLRMGAASHEIEIAAGGRMVRAAVTVSSLGPRKANPGFVVVIDDLTDLLHAQKTAAWQEVAQRIAHEIKNPLTPIQISAQRLLRYLDRTPAARLGGAQTEFEKLAADCAKLIEREVQTLESLVNEFSQFARFPAARLAPADVNVIVTSAIELFAGRLDGVAVRTELAASLPQVKADPELMRQVIANLIDNAAEAMEGSPVRQLRVATRADSDGDAVEIEIADSGCGISPADKERLFLPHFSTKNRGTGLGLAIASRIVAEHNGTIRVEDNLPVGARFTVRFPAAEPLATAPAQTPAGSSVS